MRKSLQYFALFSASVLLMISGCHTFYPGSQWQNQRYQNNPYGVQPPQGAYIAPPGQIQPGTNLGQPGTLEGSGSSNRGNDPTFNSGINQANQLQGSDSASDFPANKPVPNYKDPNENQFAPNPINKNGSGKSSEDLGSPFGNGSSSNTQSSSSNGVKFAEFTTPEKGNFKSPVSSTDDQSLTGSGPEFAAEAMPNPYAHDAKNYDWLRGKVSYDEKGKTWHIIYSLNPDPQDKFGGDLTLQGVPKNRGLEDGDVILVEGFVDNQNQDARGKPLYQINKMFGPLAPKGNFAKDEKIQAQVNN